MGYLRPRRPCCRYKDLGTPLPTRYDVEPLDDFPTSPRDLASDIKRVRTLLSRTQDSDTIAWLEETLEELQAELSLELN